MGTIFKINFDFTSQSQNTILKQLQAGKYKLLGYKGASGPSQVTAGLPTWFAEKYIDIFGQTEIDYEPLYKVYVYNKSTIGANTTITMEVLSKEIPLGTAVTFDGAGNFSTTPNAPAGIITVFNDRSADTQNVTVGLAAKVNGKYAPFCAFTSTPQGSVSMEPNEKVLLFAAETDMVSGSVTGNATAPGCTFDFNAADLQYQLEMIPVTLGITSAPGGKPVTETKANANLGQLLNTPS